MAFRERVQEAVLDAITSDAGIALRHRGMGLAYRLRGERRRVRYFFGYESPYSYLYALRILEIPHRYAIDVDWLAIAPSADAAREDNREIRVRYALADCRREAEAAGLPFKRTEPPSPEAVDEALAATEAARALADVGAFVVTMGAAIWGEGLNMADPATLRRVCEQVGVSHEAVDRAKMGGQHRKICDANAQLLAKLGHWDSAVAELDRELFATHSRYEMLTERLDKMGLRR